MTQTKSYTFEDLKEDVRKEAEALRVHATSEELGGLEVELFDPQSRCGCIYGMATGDCFSGRAIELIKKCCVRYFRNEGFTDINREGFVGIMKRVNGVKVKDFEIERLRTTPTHYSAIEAYILLPKANNANLIAYLRGETETLEL